MPETLSLKSPSQPENTYSVTLPAKFGEVTRPDFTSFLATVEGREPRDLGGETLAKRFYGDRPTGKLIPLSSIRNMGSARRRRESAPFVAVDTDTPPMGETTLATSPDASTGRERTARRILVDAQPTASPESLPPAASQETEQDADTAAFVKWMKNLPPGLIKPDEAISLDDLRQMYEDKKSFAELVQEARGERPQGFTHAGTGERLSLADVKAHMAAADTSPDTIGVIADYAAEVAPSTEAVTYEFSVGENGKVYETQTSKLDDKTTLKVIMGLDGEVAEVSVEAIGDAPAEGDDTPEQHTVTVVEPTPEHPAIVAIDDVPVDDPESLQIAANVVEHAAELASESAGDAPANDVPMEQQEAAMPATVEEDINERQQAAAEQLVEAKPPVAAEEDEEQTRQNMLSGARTAVEAYVRNRETLAALQRLGVDFTELNGKFASGEIDLTPEKARAFRELIQQAHPNSPLWSTKPGANSVLGRAADAQRARLAEILKSL